MTGEFIFTDIIKQYRYLEENTSTL